MSEEPVTFRETSFALFDVVQNAVCTTRWGNLAIFSVRGIAEQAATKLKNVTVVEVRIDRVIKH